MKTDNRITVILAHLSGDVVGIYAQKKLDELDEELGIQNWDNFAKEIKTTFISRLQKVDLVSFYFLSYFYFIFDLFLIFLFLEL